MGIVWKEIGSGGSSAKSLEWVSYETERHCRNESSDRVGTYIVLKNNNVSKLTMTLETDMCEHLLYNLSVSAGNDSTCNITTIYNADIEDYQTIMEVNLTDENGAYYPYIAIFLDVTGTNSWLDETIRITSIELE